MGKSRPHDGAVDHIRPIKLMLRRRVVIDPEKSRSLIYWDIASAFLLVIVAVWTPFETAFMDCSPPGDVRWMANQAINLFFFVDMCLQFFLAVPVSTAYGTRVVYDHRTIVKRYCRTWFLLDFVSVLPFELLAPCEGLGAVRVVRLIRLLKMLRLLRGLRVFKRWQEDFGFSYRMLMLNCIFGMVLFSAHWIACVLGMIARESCLVDILEDGNGVTRNSNGHPCVVTWLTTAHLAWEEGTGHTPFHMYVMSLHGSMSILVHPHSYTVTGPGEGLCLIFLMLVGGVVWTQVISRSTSLCTSLDRHNIAYHQTMDDVNHISRELGLSSLTMKRLRKFFLRTSKFSKQETWRSIEARMSPQLRRDTACEVNKTWVLKMSFLPRVTTSFITDISSAVRPQVFAEMEHLGEPHHLYVVMLGLASLTTSRKRAPRILGPGSVWGEDHLLLNCPDLLQDNTALALHFVQCMHLAKTDFEDICELYPEYHHAIRWAVVKLAFRRGLVRLAERTVEQREAERRALLSECQRRPMMGSTYRMLSEEEEDVDGKNSDVPEMLAWLRRKRSVALAASGATGNSSGPGPKRDHPRAKLKQVLQVSGAGADEQTDSHKQAMQEISAQVKALVTEQTNMAADMGLIKSNQREVIFEQRRLADAIMHLARAVGGSTNHVRFESATSASSNVEGEEAVKVPRSRDPYAAVQACTNDLRGPYCASPTKVCVDDDYEATLPTPPDIVACQQPRRSEHAPRKPEAAAIPHRFSSEPAPESRRSTERAGRTRHSEKL